MRLKNLIPFTVLALTVLSTQIAVACPDINGILDMNCDQKLVIVTFGDSITAGVGDRSDLGYPGRLKRLLPAATIYNFGDPGEKTHQGKARAARKIPPINNADFVIILEGVNDYFVEDHTPGSTKDNLLSMVRSGEQSGGITLLSRLTAVRRSFQKSWVSSVNSAIRRDTRIDFFSLGENIIGSDLLHPNGSGYETMASFVVANLINESNDNRPVDTDKDGIYDFAEAKFGSSVTTADSDGDGLLDGAEVFSYKSNPRSNDSDGDGLSDSYEVNTLQSNPADSKPGAPKINSVQAVAS